MDALGISQWYENNVIARVIINAIPYLGGSFDIALSSSWSKFQQNRIEDMLCQLDGELKDLKKSMVDKSVLESQEFFDLVFQIASVQSRIDVLRQE